MNNAHTTTTEATMDRTFGIEIEACGITMRQAEAAITAAGIECQIESYGHRTPRAWKIVSDASVPGGWEVVSPILTGEGGLAQVRSVMNGLSRAGATVNKNCGLHVHIGARDFTVAEFRTIAKNYVVFENFFDAIMPASRRGNGNIYIKSNRGRFGGYGAEAMTAAMTALAAASSVRQIVHTMNPPVMSQPGGDRYYKLNLTAFYRHGTIEFRQHSGTVDADKACNWIRLLVQFVNRAKYTRQRPQKAGSLTSVFCAFFRAFDIDKAGEDLRPYFTARRRAFHGE